MSMTITATLTVSPAAPAHGGTVTATYAVSGNTATPPQDQTVSGDATFIGGPVLHVTTTVTLPGTPNLPESYSVPTCPGLTFVATANPKVFTALVP